VNVDKFSSGVGKTKCEADFSGGSLIARQRPVCRISVNLQHALESGKLAGDLFFTAALRKHVGHRRRRRAAPRPIIGCMRPELAGFGMWPARLNDRHRGLIAEQPRIAVHLCELQLVQALQHPGHVLHPSGQSRAVDWHADQTQDLHLPIQRRIPAVFGNRDMADQRGRDHATLDQPRRRWRLDDPVIAGPANIFRADRSYDAQHGRNAVQHLALILTDPMQLAGTAAADCRLRFDGDVDARQVFGQSADVAVGFLSCGL
jgi:hypothetical protein